MRYCAQNLVALMTHDVAISSLYSRLLARDWTDETKRQNLESPEKRLLHGIAFELVRA